jgi:hypothetical protein
LESVLKSTLAGWALFFALFLNLAMTANGQEKKLTRDQMVLKDREQMTGNSDWIYDDLDQAKTVAREQGKPLMVVLRCIP